MSANTCDVMLWTLARLVVLVTVVQGYTNLTGCNVTNVQTLPWKPILDVLPSQGHEDFYVVAQTRELLPNTNAQVVSLGRVENSDPIVGTYETTTTAQVADAQSQLTCQTISHLHDIYDEDHLRLEGHSKFGYEIDMYLLAGGLDEGLAVFVQMFQNGQEQPDANFVGLWTTNKTKSVNRALAKSALDTMCGRDVDAQGDFFTTFQVDTGLTPNCTS